MTSTSNFVSTLLPYVPTAELTPLLEGALRKVAAEDVRLPELSVSDRVFRTQEVAFASLYKTISPGSAVAVRVGNERAAFNHPTNRVYQKLSERLARSTAAVKSYLANIVEREETRSRTRQEKTGRSALRECGGCGSKVNFLSRVAQDKAAASTCPVCSAEYLMTSRDQNRYKALVEQRDNALRAFQDAKAEHEEKVRAPVWVILENRLPMMH